MNTSEQILIGLVLAGLILVLFSCLVLFSGWAEWAVNRWNREHPQEKK
jgi:hypothetical protein